MVHRVEIGGYGVGGDSNTIQLRHRFFFKFMTLILREVVNYNSQAGYIFLTGLLHDLECLRSTTKDRNTR